MPEITGPVFHECEPLSVTVTDGVPLACPMETIATTRELDGGENELVVTVSVPEAV